MNDIEPGEKHIFALIIRESDGALMGSYGDYDSNRLQESVTEQLQKLPGTYALRDDEARLFLWKRDWKGLSANNRWMIETALREYKTDEDRMTQRVNNLVARAQARIMKAGFVKVCGRCGGTGRYSYNMIDGTLCYGCRGRKQTVAKLDKATKKKIDQYFDERFTARQ